LAKYPHTRGRVTPVAVKTTSKVMKNLIDICSVTAMREWIVANLPQSRPFFAFRNGDVDFG
jgi:hypothetical protein